MCLTLPKLLPSFFLWLSEHHGEVCENSGDCMEGLCCTRHLWAKVCMNMLDEGDLCTKKRDRVSDMFQRCDCKPNLSCKRVPDINTRLHACFQVKSNQASDVIVIDSQDTTRRQRPDDSENEVPLQQQGSSKSKRQSNHPSAEPNERNEQRAVFSLDPSPHRTVLKRSSVKRDRDAIVISWGWSQAKPVLGLVLHSSERLIWQRIVIRLAQITKKTFSMWSCCDVSKGDNSLYSKVGIIGHRTVRNKKCMTRQKEGWVKNEQFDWTAHAVPWSRGFATFKLCTVFHPPSKGIRRHVITMTTILWLLFCHICVHDFMRNVFNKSYIQLYLKYRFE